MNSQRNRSKLVNHLFSANTRSTIDLLPHYSRLIATLTRAIADIGPQLVALLEEQFAYLNRIELKAKQPKQPQNVQNDTEQLDQKLINVRFLSELVKFKLCKFPVIFKVLNECVKNFRGHMLIQLSEVLQCCGRFLYLTPATNKHIEKLLDIMMAKKSARR